MQPGNPFLAPPPPGVTGPAPRIKDLDGCLVAFQATRFDANQPGYGKDAPPADRVTATIYLLETRNLAPLQIGGSEAMGRPHSHTTVGPAKFEGVWIQQTEIVKALAPGGQLAQGLMVGRIAKGTQGNRPWLLMDVTGTPDLQKAIDIWTRLMAGAIAYTEPTPLPGFAPAPPASVSYGPQQGMAAHQQLQAPYGAATSPLPPATQPVQDPAYAAFLAAQQAATMPQYAPPAPAPQVAPAQPGVVIPPPPAGWDAQVWYTMPASQRDQILAAMAAQQQYAAPTPGASSNL